jgi:hypothetical protein
MLKWDVYQEDNHFIRLPRLLYWVIVAIYTLAFLLVLLGWTHWLGLILNHNQTIFSLLR